MIVVRNSFQLKFGKAKEARTLAKEGMSLLRPMGMKDNRACIDLTGPFYTLVLENTWESLADFEKAMSDMGSNKEWQAWYAKFMPIVESGHREIYSLIV